jgi:hypothetical protein
MVLFVFGSFFATSVFPQQRGAFTSVSGVGAIPSPQSLPPVGLQPSPAIVADPSRYNAERLTVFNELHDTWIKDLQNRVGSLETGRTWIIGLSSGVTIGLALVVWLRKLIIRQLMDEADVLPKQVVIPH